MKVTETRLPGCVVIEPRVFGDDRGFFFESFNLASSIRSESEIQPLFQAISSGQHTRRPWRASMVSM